jgi:hypothetical protein
MLVCGGILCLTHYRSEAWRLMFDESGPMMPMRDADSSGRVSRLALQVISGSGSLAATESREAQAGAEATAEKIAA